MKTETIEEKTYRIMVDLHKFTGPVPTLEESLKDSIFLTVRDALELAITEERADCCEIANEWAMAYVEVDCAAKRVGDYINEERAK